MSRGVTTAESLVDVLTRGPHRAGRVMHVHVESARDARWSPWPAWVDPVVRERFGVRGITQLWSHQVPAAELAWSGRSVAVATGTASGKSAAYLIPALTAARPERPGARRGGTTLYLAPTKALAADQLRVIDELAIPGVVTMPYDGDTPKEVRDVARAHAAVLLSNPDMLHRSLLPTHERWASFLGRLRFVVIDESHVYRGVFGSHVAQVLRRLRRVCEGYGSAPTFVAASATSADPEASVERLLGMPVTAVTDDGSPRGARTFLLWEPPLLSGRRSPHDRPLPTSNRSSHASGRPSGTSGRSGSPASPDLSLSSVGRAFPASGPPSPARPGHSSPLPTPLTADRAAPAAGHSSPDPMAPAAGHGSPASDRYSADPTAAATGHTPPTLDHSSPDPGHASPDPTALAAGCAAPAAGHSSPDPMASAAGRTSAVSRHSSPDPGNPSADPEAVPGERHRNVLPETADLLTDLVVAGARTVAFVRSRRGAEVVADLARTALAETDATLPDRVAAYRSGYLPHERRDLEAALQSGSLLGVAATTALELGVDVNGLDAVVVAGWPGTRASLFQQAGRAGRSGRDSVAVLVARDDPLDAYVVRHPEAVFGRPVESTVLDPDNPYVLAPHLCAAAAERPLTPEDLDRFGPAAPDVVTSLERQGLLRRRRGPRWHWTRSDRADALADLRGSGEPVVALMEDATGRLLGTVDAARAHSTAHPGAVYVHQGETYVVDSLDLADGVATLHADRPPYTTSAQEVSSLRILETSESRHWGPIGLHRGVVEVSTQVVGYLERALGTGEVLGSRPLDLPVRTLRTVAVWWTVPDDVVTTAGIDRSDAPGAAHAAEHAAIGMLPLMANCDRWDVGGLSTVRHPDTGLLTVFVHDGHPGGAGFAERGFHAAASWLCATREAILSCPCTVGCPSCVYSPKCGNGNNPLHKAGAVRLLDAVLADAPRTRR